MTLKVLNIQIINKMSNLHSQKDIRIDHKEVLGSIPTTVLEEMQVNDFLSS